MKKNIEIEYKTLTTKTKFENFLSNSSISTEVYQVNYFYDTIDFQLYKLGVILRVRKINNTFLFTLKERTRSNSIEHEMEISANDLSFLDNAKISALLSKFELTQPIVLVGELATMRKTFSDSFGEWCFDHNFYNNIEDYEIEFELHPGIKNAFKHFLAVLRQNNIRYKKAPGKRYRCLFNKKLDS